MNLYILFSRKLSTFAATGCIFLALNAPTMCLWLGLCRLHQYPYSLSCIWVAALQHGRERMEGWGEKEVNTKLFTALSHSMLFIIVEWSLCIWREFFIWHGSILGYRCWWVWQFFLFEMERNHCDITTLFLRYYNLVKRGKIVYGHETGCITCICNRKMGRHGD